MVNDYFSSSMIPRTADGSLDYAAAQQLAASGNIVLAIYKNPDGGMGHVVFVNGDIAKNGTVMTDGYSNKAKDVVPDGTFTSQFGKDTIKNTDFFVVR